MVVWEANILPLGLQKQCVMATTTEISDAFDAYTVPQCGKYQSNRKFLKR